MKIVYFLALASTLYSETSLISLIDSAQHNERIESYIHQSNAAVLGYESAKYSYFPRIDGFGSGTFVDNTGGFDAKESYSAGVKGEFILFDGFKRENLLDQNRALEKVAKHNLESAKKEVSLQVIKVYYEFQNTLDEINTLNRMAEQLEAQLIRLEKFKIAGLASEDSLMRMRSEVSDTHFKIENLHYQADRQKADLEILTNQTISELAEAEILPPKEVQIQELDKLNSLKYARDAKIHEAQLSDSQNLPTIKLEDQYSFNDYKNDPIADMRVDQQNRFIASVSMNLIDFSAASSAKQALLAQAQAQNSELAYATKEANQNRLLAQRYIERSRLLIESSEQTYEASSKTFEAVKKKYEARIVDYVTYLDALHGLADSFNQLHRSKRTLNYAHAAYYYYAGLDPKEFVK